MTALPSPGHPSPASPAQLLRISGPEDVAVTIPHVLGFHPTESLVLVGLRGPRRRMGLTARVDLAEVATGDLIRPDALADLAQRLARSGADAVLVAVFTSAPDRGRELRYAALPAAVDRFLPVVEAVLVRDGRCWTYGCDGPCCPAEGRPLPAQGRAAVTVGAAFAAVGSAVLPDRAAVVAQVAPLPEATDGTAKALLAAVRRADRGRRLPAALAYEEELTGRLLLGCADPRFRPQPADAVALAVVLDRIAVRDALLLRWASESGPASDPARRGAWRRLLLEVARSVPDRPAAPVLTCFAAAAYDEGDGVLVDAALDRALRGRPGYSLALLLRDLLGHQMPPAQVVAALAGRPDPGIPA
jgi:hypothetical protein